MAEDYPDEVNALIIPWMMARTKEEIMKLCQDKRVPCVPIYDIAEVVNHRQIKAMDFFVELDHPEAGKLKYAKGPCTFEKTDGNGRHPRLYSARTTKKSIVNN